MRKGIITTAETPKVLNNDLYNLLREEKIEEFNKRRPRDGQHDLSGLDFRGLDLRGLDVEGIDFSNSYFRDANLGGINFSQANLQGASIKGANISGVYFPKELSVLEIWMSNQHGTRMRYNA